MSPTAEPAPRTTVEVTAARGLARHAALVKRVARTALAELGEAGSELSVALVHDDEMHRLNRSWRGKDRTTDVLAFALREGEATDAQAPGLLGDVVISVPTAERQARERGHATERELTELLLHGILHLLGFDHERSPADARRMFAKQRALLAVVERGEAATTAGASPRRTRGPRSAPPPRAR